MASQSTGEPWSVESKLSSLRESPPKTQTTSPVPFFHMLTRLKTTKREGWRRFNITDGESISDHMYRMALITMFAPPSLSARLDIARCTKMALVHDMAELLVGDITPVDNISKQEKSRRESTTMDYLTTSLLGNVGGGVAGEDIRAVWEEYETGDTLESKFVHDVDKVELLLQMLEYEQASGANTDLGEFAWVATRVVLPEVKQWCEEILDARRELWRSRGIVPSDLSGGVNPIKKGQEG
ncbi:MAG: hypothetical protein M1825_005682 [Sarcosagium campestre]|nr:MAG: hypothetical protein M1825_005682 [Sarcosagium campestre]